MVKVVKKVKAKSAPKRTRAGRMDSDARREFILETAAQIILSQGLSECTLEEVGIQAGVSKALIYKYYPNREGLMAALMMREFNFIKNRGLVAAQEDVNIEQFYRERTERYFEYVKDRGAILKALFNDRGIYNLLINENRNQRRAIENFNIKKIKQSYNLPDDLARLGVLLTLYSPDNAERMLKSGEITPERAADFWITFLLGGWLATAVQFGDQDSPSPEKTKTKTKTKAKTAKKSTQKT